MGKQDILLSLAFCLRLELTAGLDGAPVYFIATLQRSYELGCAVAIIPLLLQQQFFDFDRA